MGGGYEPLAGDRGHAAMPPVEFTSEWQDNALFGCFRDCGVCCLTWWLPCITYGRIRRALHGGQSPDCIDPCILYCLVLTFTGCQCILGMMNRGDLRRKYNLRDVPCNDCCVHWCCHPCALSQEMRELNLRPLTVWPVPQYYTAPGAAHPGPYTPPVAPVPGQGASAPPPMPQGPVNETDIKTPPTKV